MFVGADDWNGNTWICDSGASAHMGDIDEGMVDHVGANEPIEAGNGNRTKALKKGTAKLRAIQKDGTTCDTSLHDCKCSPALGGCMFSLAKALARGWTIANKDICVA